MSNNGNYDPKTLKNLPKYAHEVAETQPTTPKIVVPKKVDVSGLLGKWGRR